jgi:hypothetical protein
LLSSTCGNNTSSVLLREKRDMKKRGDTMANLLWTVIVVLFVLWLLGFLLHIGGGLIHLLLVIALIALVINLVTGRRPVA